MKNPVTTASGTFGSGAEYGEYVDLNRLGAVTTKGVANVPWSGNPTPRIVETHGGMQCLQTGRFCGTILARGDPFGVPGGAAGGDPGDAGLSHDRQLLYYGAQHGT